MYDIDDDRSIGATCKHVHVMMPSQCKHTMTMVPVCWLWGRLGVVGRKLTVMHLDEIIPLLCHWHSPCHEG